MLTFHYIVSAKLYGCHVLFTQAFWSDRTLPLLVNVRDQLLQTFHVLAVVSNFWAKFHHIICRGVNVSVNERKPRAIRRLREAVLLAPYCYYYYYYYTLCPIKHTKIVLVISSTKRNQFI